jgi:hypothetical protein
MPTVNEAIADLEVRHQVGLQRFGTQIVRKIIALLNRVDADLVAQMQKLDPTSVAPSFKQARLEKLLEAVRVINRDAYALLQKELTGELTGLAGYESEFQTRLIGSQLPIEWDIVTPAAEHLRAAVVAQPFQGKLLKEWVG